MEENVNILQLGEEYNYGAHWVKNIKDNVICLNKQQIKHAVAT